MNNIVDEEVKLICVDCFCGAGGESEGLEQAVNEDGNRIAVVVIGINHDSVAIASHAANHPETHHFIEDFRALDPWKLINILHEAKRKYVNAKVLFWMSAECTNHSIAKGGMSRDADSRSLPEHAYKYIEILKPDIIGIENVKEFLDWGELEIKVITNKKGMGAHCPLDIKTDKKTKKKTYNPTWVPIKEKKGEYYRAWRDHIKSYGYHYDYSLLNAADFGARTSRIRYFGLFAKNPENIVFPEPTHSKSGEDGKEKWLPVRDCLELEKEGDSIFGRKKDLSPNTISRITSGGIRFVGGGRKNYKPIKLGKKTKVLPAYDEAFLSKAYSGDPYSKNASLDNPSGSVTCKDHHQLIKADFMTVFYGNGFNADLDEPCPTATTKDRFAVVSSYIVNSYTGGGQLTALDSACPAIMTTPKQNLIHLTGSKKWLLNPQFGNDGGSIDNPCFTLIARMGKKPPSMVTMSREGVDLPDFITIIGDTVQYLIYPDDSPEMVELKMFMATYGILDIKMRMLYVSELLRIMGFPDSYELKGNQTDQKKFIGNAVEVTQATANAKAVAGTIRKRSKLALNTIKYKKAII